jgi:hypothetical protein
MLYAHLFHWHQNIQCAGSQSAQGLPEQQSLLIAVEVHHSNGRKQECEGSSMTRLANQIATEG